MITAAAPTFFGHERRLAGWYTPPAPGAVPRDVGVLLCQPIGHEYMCSSRAFRVLARDLATRGFAVFRFDYCGTGDSADLHEESSLVPEWIDNVLLAAEELRSRSCCGKIAMIGLRFGATLAAKVAERCDCVDALVLWSPTISGRSFVRQTRLLALAAAPRADGSIANRTGLESVGFFLGPETVAEIGRINMCDGAYPVQNVLIMSRIDGPSESALLGAIERDGIHVEEKFYDGHAEFLVTPLVSVLPYAALTTIAQWLDELCPAANRRIVAPRVSATGNFPGFRSDDDVIESGVTFSDARIAGVLTEPAMPSDNPAVVLLNTGADHHVGPHRMYVPLARLWATLGFPVLRFDLVGLGDSESDESVAKSDSYPLSAPNDVRDAIAFLRHERGFKRIILAGVCSGAFHALHTTGVSLSGIIAVNPPLFHHAGDPILPDLHYNDVVEARRVAASLLRPTKWRRLVRGEVEIVHSINVLIRRSYKALRSTVVVIALKLTNKKSDGESAAALFDKDLPIHLIFNQGDKGQVFFEYEIAPRLKRSAESRTVTVDVVPGADHTFMPLFWQNKLAQLMTARLLEHQSPNQRSALPPATRAIAQARI